MTSQIKSRREYLTQTRNILVLLSQSNLARKSTFIGRFF